MKRVRVLGHPVHPPTVHLPLGLWAAAAVWDAAALATGRPAFWTLSAGCLGLGVIAALPTIVTGLLDLVALEVAAAETAALWHMGLMAVCWCFYLMSVLLRGGLGEPKYRAAAVSLQFVGAACLSIGGWLGGHLVYSHGVGVGERYNGGDGAAAR